jgi:hypothetical protein
LTDHGGNPPGIKTTIYAHAPVYIVCCNPERNHGISKQH